MSDEQVDPTSNQPPAGVEAPDIDPGILGTAAEEDVQNPEAVARALALADLPEADVDTPGAGA